MVYVKKLAMVIIMVPNIEQAVAFYALFGLRLRFHLKDAWAEFSLGDTKLGICPANNPAGDRRTGIVLEVEDLYGVYAALKETVIFLGEPKKALHGIMVSFRDPGGNILDLYQPTPEKIGNFLNEVAQKQ
jgi:catechol 2,3-dioxygenase-like lactoylglutathione lyase family enzyme